jgi:hypothetical protein
MISTLFQQDKAHNDCCHSKTSFDVTLNILKACKATWLSQHTYTYSPAQTFPTHSFAQAKTANIPA